MRRLQPPSPRTQATYVSPIVSKHRRRRRGRGVGCSCPYWSAMDIDAGRLRDKSWTAWAIMLLGALQGQSSQSKTARNRATGRENPCAAERTPGDPSRDIHSFGCFSVLDGLNVQLDPCNALVRPVQHQNRNLWESEHRIAANYPDPGSQPILDDVAALAACICETPYA